MEEMISRVKEGFKTLQERKQQRALTEEPPSERKPYKYQPLPSGKSIRLLRIDQCDPLKACKLTCSLNIFELGVNCPKYDALSYTWGPPLDSPESEAEYGPAQDVAIFLDSGQHHEGIMRIGRNLFDALHHVWKLRTDPLSFKPAIAVPQLTMYVWADAICIHQSDDAEKAVQVGFMGEIYANAEMVIAWTGQDDGTFEDIAQFHFLCTAKMNAWMEKYFIRPSPTYCEGTEEGYRIVGPDINLTTKIVQSVSTFYIKRRYPSRLWICQELALAKASIFVLGNHIVPVKDFVDCARFFICNQAIVQMLWAEALMTHNTLDYAALGRIRYLQARMEPLSYAETQFHESLYGKLDCKTRIYCVCLINFADACQANKCSDPRDKIYALLGMLNRHVFPNTTPPLAPDYAKSTQSVFYETTSLLLTQLPYLSTLASVDHAPSPAALRIPSWIPTFGIDRSRKGAPLSVIRARIIDRERRMYNASGRYAHDLGTDNFTVSELRLHGTPVGKVHSCLPLEPLIPGEFCMMEYIRTYLGILTYIYKIYSHFGAQYHSGQGTSEVIMQSLTLSEYDGDLLKQFTESFRVWASSYLALLRDLSRNPEFEIGERESTQFSEAYAILRKISNIPGAPTEDEALAWERAFDQEDGSAEFSRQTTLFTNALTQATQGRGMFIMEPYFGIGPVSMEPGDQVWILIPGRVPYVLRPSEEGTRFLFVGECYVHGIMFGEAINLVDDAELLHVTLI